MIEITTGEGKSYPILFNTNALTLAEDALNMGWAQILGSMATMGIRPLRTLLWAGLEGARLRIQKESGKTQRAYTQAQAGDIMDDVPGGFPAIANALMDAAREAQVLAIPALQNEGDSKNEAPASGSTATDSPKRRSRAKSA